MSQPWVDKISQLYAAAFAGVSVFALGVASTALMQLRYHRRTNASVFRMALDHAYDLALLSLSGCAALGIVLFIGCFWFNREPTNLLANCMLGAIVATVGFVLLVPI